MNLFEKKSLERILAESESGKHQLKRTLGPVNLVALGIGAIIGAGLFSLTGIAAADHAGPAVVLSFVVAAIGCAFAGMCYSEFSTMIPIAGSAYTYAYATMGELLAWIIGWDLVIEYAIGAATVSVSWSSYVVKLLHRFGVELPRALTHCPWDEQAGLINLPAVFIIVAISCLLIVGISESARVNAVIVVVKVTIVIIVIFVGYSYVKPENYVPFIPPNTGVMGEFGWSGIMRAAGVIFFAYIGFDAVSTAAQEAKKPQRDMPIGIIGSLAVCTLLYIAFSRVLTGMVPYRTFHGDAAPVATVISLFPSAGLQTAIYFGIIAGYSSVILVMLLGQSRVFYSMSRDGLLPQLFSFIHPKFRTPSRSNLIVMCFTAILGGFIPISNLSHFTSIGTLLAFVIVCIGIIVMRKTNPNAPRPYRTPLVPLVPILGVLVCFGMMAFLDMMTWIRLGVWLAIGLVIYFTYSRHHSHLMLAVREEEQTALRPGLHLLLAAAAMAQQAQNPSPMVEHSRTHQRLKEETLAGKREKLELGTLFVPSGLKGGKLLLFFHGGTWLPEVAAARNGMAVISVQAGAGSGTYAKLFEDPKRFLKLVAAAEDAAGRRFTRITLGGWSAGCGALRQILQDPEAYRRVDAAVLIDGMHTDYAEGKPGPLDSKLGTENLRVWLQLGRDAIAGKKRVVVTHSEIFPGTFASTTETADYVVTQLGLKLHPVLKWGPMGTQQISEASAGRFRMLGFAGNSAPDHVDQLHSLPVYLKWVK